MDLGTGGLGEQVGLDSGCSGPIPKRSSSCWDLMGFWSGRDLALSRMTGGNRKMAKTVDFSTFEEIGENQLLTSDCGFSDDQKQQQIPVFASSKSSDSLSMEKSSPDAALPYIHYRLAGSSRNEVASAELGAPLTQYQWMELGNQSLIYKYITSNVPVPSHLLLPISKALHCAASPCISECTEVNASFTIHAYVGFNNADPEPERCRRTDGKKWRCSREAVADQKYCEKACGSPSRPFRRHKSDFSNRCRCRIVQ